MNLQVLPVTASIVLFAYLLGSIPFGLLIARSRGVDIREHGSGNIGATNVWRVLGKKCGLLTFAGDLLKGLLAVLIGKWIATHWAIHVPLPHGRERIDYFDPGFAGIAAALGCVLGHSFPVWLGFKGGKGVATSLGVIFGMMPLGGAARIRGLGADLQVIALRLARFGNRCGRASGHCHGIARPRLAARLGAFSFRRRGRPAASSFATGPISAGSSRERSTGFGVPPPHLLRAALLPLIHPLIHELPNRWLRLSASESSAQAAGAPPSRCCSIRTGSQSLSGDIDREEVARFARERENAHLSPGCPLPDHFAWTSTLP